MITEITARLDHPVLFGVAIGVVYFVFRVVGMRGSPADALVSAFYAAAIAVLVRLFFNRMKVARK